MTIYRLFTLAFIHGLVFLTALSVCAEHNVPPEGFVALFNGKDLSGWRGLGHVDPRELKLLSSDQRAERQKRDDADLARHWRVENGELVNDGAGAYLATPQDHKDFELLIDWKMLSHESDSGIYLRGCPQVQIWSSTDPTAQGYGSAAGSGGLWNNNEGSPGRFPLAKADRPVGTWNRFRIKIVGDRVTVVLNDQLVVDDAVMHNFFDRSNPIFDSGPIQLQTHGGEIRFRNIYIRTISSKQRTPTIIDHTNGVKHPVSK